MPGMQNELHGEPVFSSCNADGKSEILTRGLGGSLVGRRHISAVVSSAGGSVCRPSPPHAGPVRLQPREAVKQTEPPTVKELVLPHGCLNIRPEKVTCFYRALLLHRREKDSL